MIKFEKIETCKAIINHMQKFETTKYSDIFEKKNEKIEINHKNEKNHEKNENNIVNIEKVIPLLQDRSVQNILRKTCVMFAQKGEWAGVCTYVYIHMIIYMVYLYISQYLKINVYVRIKLLRKVCIIFA
jgi:hypothetical protein